MPFVDSGQLHVNCAGGGGAIRSIASRLWHGHQAPSAELVVAARSARTRLEAPAGRVESAGTFEDAAIEAELGRALSPTFSTFTRRQLEWYGCAGAFFHNDAHYDGVLFGVWCLAGPPRALVFPRAACRFPATTGSLVVFDPFEPHAVLASSAIRYNPDDYQGTERNLFLGFEITLAPEVRTVFGIGEVWDGAPTLSSRIAINPETGALVTSTA
jgi:hypothetical protein